MHASFNSLIYDFSPDIEFSTGRNDVVEELGLLLYLVETTPKPHIRE